MRALFLCQVIEELANARVGGSCRRSFVEATRLHLDGARLLAHGFEAERPYQPHRLSLDEALHVLAADEGNVLSEFRAKEIDQSTPVPGLFGPHAIEYRGGRREVLSQTFREIGIDAFVFLLQRNGK